jgi:hypothetical protein
MTEAQENELAGMITDVAISYANGHATDFRIAAKAAIAFVNDANQQPGINADLLKALEWCASQGWLRYTKRIPAQNAKFCDGVDAVHAAIAKAKGVSSDHRI